MSCCAVCVVDMGLAPISKSGPYGFEQNDVIPKSLWSSLVFRTLKNMRGKNVVRAYVSLTLC